MLSCISGSSARGDVITTPLSWCWRATSLSFSLLVLTHSTVASGTSSTVTITLPTSTQPNRSLVCPTGMVGVASLGVVVVGVASLGVAGVAGVGSLDGFSVDTCMVMFSSVTIVGGVVGVASLAGVIDCVGGCTWSRGGHTYIGNNYRQ